MAKSTKPAPELTDVEEQIKAIRDELANLGGLLKEIAGAKASQASSAFQAEAEELAKKGRQTAEDAAQHAKRIADDLEEHIVKKPLQSALIALLIGIFIGSLGRR